MDGTFVGNVVIKQRAVILQQFPTEDEPLLLRRNILSILDHLPHALNQVVPFHIQRDGLALLLCDRKRGEKKCGGEI